MDETPDRYVFVGFMKSASIEGEFGWRDVRRYLKCWLQCCRYEYFHTDLRIIVGCRGIECKFNNFNTGRRDEANPHETLYHVVNYNWQDSGMRVVLDRELKEDSYDYVKIDVTEEQYQKLLEFLEVYTQDEKWVGDHHYRKHNGRCASMLSRCGPVSCLLQCVYGVFNCGNCCSHCWGKCCGTDADSEVDAASSYYCVSFVVRALNHAGIDICRGYLPELLSADDLFEICTRKSKIITGNKFLSEVWKNKVVLHMQIPNEQTDKFIDSAYEFFVRKIAAPPPPIRRPY